MLFYSFNPNSLNSIQLGYNYLLIGLPSYHMLIVSLKKSSQCPCFVLSQIPFSALILWFIRFLGKMLVGFLLMSLEKVFLLMERDSTLGMTRLFHFRLLLKSLHPFVNCYLLKSLKFICIRRINTPFPIFSIFLKSGQRLTENPSR